MSRRANAYIAVLAATATVALPAAGWASSGGGGVGGSPGSSGPAVQSGDAVVSANGGDMSIQAKASTFLRNQLGVTGNAPPGYAGATVEVQRLGHETGWKWANTAHSTVAGDGSFDVVWNTNHIGRFELRAVIFGGSSVRAAAATPSLTVTVYRPSVATQYGPGFWRHRTACGEVLRKRTLGVANRTLPCGTQVAIYFRGRSIVVPVIDRGPYANGADWDLTVATGRALGIPGTATVGAVSLPQAPAR